MTYKAFAILSGSISFNGFTNNTLFTVSFNAIVFDESTGYTILNPPPYDTGGTYISQISDLIISDDNESLGDAIQGNIESAFGVSIRKLVIMTGRQ